MKSTPSPSNSFPTRFAEWILRHRWAILFGSLVAVLAAGFGASRLQMRNYYRIFFSEENPQLTAYEEFQRIYTKEDSVFMVVSWPGHDVFSPDYLEAVQWLTEEAWQLPFASRVDSVTNFQHSVAIEDDLEVGDLVRDPAAMTAEQLAEAKRVAHADRLLKDRVVGPQPHVTGVNVRLLLPEEDAMEAVTAAHAVRDLRERFIGKFPGFDMKLTGIVMLNNAFAEASMRDMSFLTPLMYLGMFLTVGILLRSFGGTIGTILVIVLSSVTGMGLMGWIGLPISPPSAIAPTIIMTLAVADSIHLLVTFLQRLRAGGTREQAIIEAVRVNFQPIFLTSLTTAIGFLSLNFSDAPPFRHLGNVVAIGVVAAWLYSIITLPALLGVMRFKVKQVRTQQSDWTDKLANIVLRNRRMSLWGSAAVVLTLGAFVPRIELNDQWVEYFDHGIEFRDHTDWVMENLSGIYTTEYSIESGESGGINDPDYLVHLDAFGEWLKAQPEVIQVNSITDIMKRLNKNMHGDDEAWYKLPDSRELAAQYLFLFEMSLPYGLDLNNQINIDKSAARLTVTTANITTNEMRSLIDRAEAWKEENLPEVMHTTATSPSVMFSYISQRNINSMLGGTFLAILLISIVLVIAFRSARYGLLSLVPNLAPAVMGFGVWALLVGSVGMSLAVVTSMTLGIVVDDSIHFISKYLRARREESMETDDAVRYAYRAVGPALLATTIILVVGFFILSFSSFRLNDWMAQLSAIVISIALILDLIMLPALLVWFDRHRTVAKRSRQAKRLTEDHAEPASV
ncbi:MMPL family transporter [Opitutaceae bacterium]|nr:MMPL family transporter [Opitutaceae bacterium]